MQGAGHRVAITGYGVVAPCGIGKEAFWTGLLGPGFSGSKSIEIENWDPLPYFDNPKDARRSDRCEQFALAAAGEAIAQSGELPYDRSRIGTIFGTGIGGLRTLEENVIIRVEKGERRVSPFLVPMMMSNASGAAISMRYGFQGPAETICTACAAATHAIGNAARLVAWGRCDAVVTGGAESAATITALAGFSNMTALSSTLVSKPFDATRDGFIMGEGAAVFVLERMDLAIARGATIIAEIVGAASNADAHHITAPSPGGVGASRCMQLALEDAGLITGYRALVDAKKLGFSLMALIYISMDQHTPERFASFEGAIGAIPEVLECLLITGQQADYQLKVIVADMDGYQNLLLNKITRIKGVSGVHTSFVLRRVVDKTEVPVG